MLSDPCDFIIFDAPWPPSINALKTITKFKGMTRIGPSNEYNKYRKTFFNFWLLLRTQGAFDFGDAAMFWTIVCPRRAGTDTDNYAKATLDCLEKAKAFSNDNVIVSQHAERGPRVRDGLMRCYLANEKRRAELTRRYFDDLERLWLPQRDGPILKQPETLLVQRL